LSLEYECLQGDVQKEETATFYMFLKTPGMNSGSMINLRENLLSISLCLMPSRSISTTSIFKENNSTNNNYACRYKDGTGKI
jgi:hypothetical protein